MSNYNSLKTTIDANIKQNGRQEITGQILNSVLNQMVTTLGAGYQFAGVATTATNPGSPDAKVFYIANGKGTYTNFGGINVTEDEVVVLYWDSAWHKEATGIASQAKLSELSSGVERSIFTVEETTNKYLGRAADKPVDFSEVIVRSYIIAVASGNWASTGEHYLIPVHVGERILINKGTYNAGIAFLSSDSCSAGEPAPMVGSYYTITKEKTLTVPNGAKFCYVAKLINDEDKTPQSFVFKEYTPIDEVPIEGSPNLVKSGGVFTDIKAVSTAIKEARNKTFSIINRYGGRESIVFDLSQNEIKISAHTIFTVAEDTYENASEIIIDTSGYNCGGLLVFTIPDEPGAFTSDNIRVIDVSDSQINLSSSEIVIAMYDANKVYCPWGCADKSFARNVDVLSIAQPTVGDSTNVGVTVGYTSANTILIDGTSTASYSFELVTDRSGNPSATPYCILKKGKTYKGVFKKIRGTASGSPVAFLKNIGGSSNWNFFEDVIQTVTITDDYRIGRVAINIPRSGLTFNKAVYVLYICEESDFYEGYYGNFLFQLPNSSVCTNHLENRCVTEEKLSLNLVDRLDLLPSYYKDAASSLITSIRRDEDPDFSFLIFTDPHIFNADKYKKYNDIFSRGGINVVLGLGDYQIYDDNVSKISTINNMAKMFTYAGRHDNMLLVVGNHDTAFVHANSGALTQNYFLTKKQNHNLFAAHLNDSVVFNEADPYGCYYYKDYTAQKIRVIVLNTSDIYNDNDELESRYKASLHLHQRQITWFSNIALDFSDKDNPNDWSVILFCHYPVSDCISAILQAAKNGTALNTTFQLSNYLTYDSQTGTYTSTVDPTKHTNLVVNKDYSVQGAINVVGIFAGHTHRENTRVENDITIMEFLCDNSQLNDLYGISVEGISAGDYYIDRGANGKQVFTLQNSYPTATQIWYNNYHIDYCEVTIVLSDNLPIQLTARTTSYQEGATELTGFTSLREAGTANTESCYVVTVDKSIRTFKVHPYGVGCYREATY